jgi:hypothetical protein
MLNFEKFPWNRLGTDSRGTSQTDIQAVISRLILDTKSVNTIADTCMVIMLMQHAPQTNRDPEPCPRNVKAFQMTTESEAQSTHSNLVLLSGQVGWKRKDHNMHHHHTIEQMVDFDRQGDFWGLIQFWHAITAYTKVMQNRRGQQNGPPSERHPT